MSLDWMGEAACADSDLDFFEYANNENVDWNLLGALVEVCVECPVIRQCAKFSMREGDIETEGIWAGTLPRQRVAITKGATDVVQAVVDTAMANYAKALTYRNAGEQLGLVV